MTTVVYLAYPIDAVDRETASIIQSDVQMLKNHIISTPGLAMYDPGRAWNCNDCEPDARIQAVNSAALSKADAVVAYMPPSVSSVGVPMEVAWASAMGIPCLVLRSFRSWALQTPNVYQFADMETIMLAIEDLEPLPRRQHQQVKYTIDGDPGDLDPTPSRGYEDDAGFDLIYFGTEPLKVPVGKSINVPAGVRIEWPPNVWGLVLGRSSTFHKRGLLVHPAVIDPGYRGEMFANVRNVSHDEHVIEPGDRIAQVIPMPALSGAMRMTLVDDLSSTVRGDKGFGSSGK